MLNSLAKKIASFWKLHYPPGHYYSPVTTPQEVSALPPLKYAYEKVDSIPAIKLNEIEQFDLLNDIAKYYADVPFKESQNDVHRYYFENDFFSYNSGIELYCLLRHWKPKRIVEVGSGFSSALMLDTNELAFGGNIELNFIEPFPEMRLLNLVKKNDFRSANIIAKKLQDVDLDLFQDLESNDLLFVDSSHVSKPGSDVNRIIFEILPLLKRGVIVHFHDIFYPFEYPKNWINDPGGFGWNELYLLRSFLMYNNDFRIVFFNSFLEEAHRDWFIKNMPLCLKKQGGSLFIVKN